MYHLIVTEYVLLFVMCGVCDVNVSGVFCDDFGVDFCVVFVSYVGVFDVLYRGYLL